MKNEPDQNVRQTYEGTLAQSYDRHVSHFFGSMRRAAIETLEVETGARVLVSCCGTGLDFESLQKKVGPSGRIVGVDFSQNMLSQAARRVERAGWENVELHQADVTRLEESSDLLVRSLELPFDAAICVLGLSTICEFRAAYRALVEPVRPGGHVMVADIQLTDGWRSVLDPLWGHLATRFGGSVEGHGNCRSVQRWMRAELDEVVRREFVFGAFFYCVGRVPSATVASSERAVEGGRSGTALN